MLCPPALDLLSFPLKHEIAKSATVPDVLYVVVELTYVFRKVLDPKNEEEVRNLGHCVTRTFLYRSFLLLDCCLLGCEAVWSVRTL